MDSYQETFETWNKIAALYEEKFMYLDVYNDTYNEICRSIVKENAKILEIGCGPGNITKYLLSQRPDFDLFGIDIAPNMIALAKENNPTAHFAVLDSRKIDEINEQYDGIVCGFCLPYLSSSDCHKLIKDCAHLLNENGLFYLSFVEGDAHESRFIVNSSGDRCYFYYHSLDELKTLLITHDFEEPRVFYIAYKKTETEFETHTIVITKKKELV